MIYNSQMRLLVPVLLLVCIPGILLNLNTSRFGMGVTGDSGAYLSGAVSIRQTSDYSRTTTLYSSPNQRDPITHYPPLYSVLLTLGEHPYDWARPLSAIAFGMTVFFTGLLCYVCCRSIAASLMAAVLIAFSATLLQIYMMIWSEQLLIPLLLLTIIFYTIYIKTVRFRYIYIAAAIAGVAVMARFAGYYLIVLGIVLLLQTKAKWKEYAIFLVISLTLPAIWIVRNILVSNEAFAFSISYHPISWREFANIVREIGAFAHTHGWIALSIITALTIAARKNIYVRLLAANLLIYLLFLTLAFSFYVGINTMNGRMLCPIIPILSVLISISVVAILRQVPQGKVKVTASLIVTMLIIFWIQDYSLFGISISERCFRWQRRYASPQWRHGEVVSAIKQLPADAQLYSGTIGGFWFLTGRPVKALPIPYSRSTGYALVPLEWQEELMNARHVMRSGYVVYLFDNTYNKKVDSDFASVVPMTLIREFKDGKIYQINQSKFH